MADSDQTDRDTLEVELATNWQDRTAHVYGVNGDTAKSVCGHLEVSTEIFDRAYTTRPVEGYEDRVECNRCRTILNLGTGDE